MGGIPGVDLAMFWWADTETTVSLYGDLKIRKWENYIYLSLWKHIAWQSPYASNKSVWKFCIQVKWLLLVKVDASWLCWLTKPSRLSRDSTSKEQSVLNRQWEDGAPAFWENPSFPPSPPYNRSFVYQLYFLMQNHSLFPFWSLFT